MITFFNVLINYTLHLNFIWLADGLIQKLSNGTTMYHKIG